MSSNANVEGRELIKTILRAIEKDQELRYALMGALGFHELLERFAQLEERQQRLEERFAQLEERVTRLEERFAQLEERFAQLEERFAQLEERVTRLEEHFLRLEERVTRLEERVTSVEKELAKLGRLVRALAHRFGVLSEKAFRDSMKHVIEEIFGTARVERWIYNDKDGIVYGSPAQVEIDVLVRDSEHVLIEIKSRVSRADVAEVYRVGILYERVTGVRPHLAIVGGFVDEGAVRLARRLGIWINTPE